MSCKHMLPSTITKMIFVSEDFYTNTFYFYILERNVYLIKITTSFNLMNMIHKNKINEE